MTEKVTLSQGDRVTAVTLWNKQISQPTRTFIDHSSAACMINESLVKKLNLRKCRNEATVRGIVDRMNLEYTVDVSLSSASDLLPPAESFPVTCYVVKDVNICANIFQTTTIQTFSSLCRTRILGQTPENSANSP